MGENKPSNMGGHGHDHMCSCHGYGHKHFVLRWLLGIVMLVIVFYLGVKVGEFKGELRSAYYGGYGRYMMEGYGPDDYNGWYGQGMMKVLPGTPATPPASNTAPTNK